MNGPHDDNRLGHRDGEWACATDDEREPEGSAFHGLIWALVITSVAAALIVIVYRHFA
jgi:hypothetical protein